MEPTHTFKLTFGAPFSNQATLRIPHANPTITNAQVIEAMDRIISANAVITPGGLLNSRQAAKITTRATTDFNLSN